MSDKENMKILDTKEILNYFRKTINGSTQYLCMVSPFLDIDPELISLIRKKAMNNVKVLIICGKKALKQVEYQKLTSIENVELKFSYKLHAKLFFNQDYAILGSMNLYKASEDNFELGVLFSKKYDFKSFGDIEKKFYDLFNKKSKVYRSDITIV